MTYSERAKWGDVRAVAHEGRPLDMMRAAARCGSAHQRRYLADNALRRGAAAWRVEYMRDLDAHALVPLASWSRPDPLECLEGGVLSLDGAPIWTVPDERPGLEWSVAERWAVLPVWEAWSIEHAQEYLDAPRRAVEALDAWLRGHIDDAELHAANANVTACATFSAAYRASMRSGAWYAANAAAWVTARAAAWATATAAARGTANADAWGTASAAAWGNAMWGQRKRQISGWTAHALDCALTGRWS